MLITHQQDACYCAKWVGKKKTILLLSKLSVDGDNMYSLSQEMLTLTFNSSKTWNDLFEEICLK